MAVQQQQNNVRFSVNVEPLPWQVKDMTNKQVPPVALVNIHFQYYQIYQRHGPSPVPPGGTISNVEIQDRNSTCQLDLWELIKLLEAYSSNILSQKLSMLGVKQDRHKEIVEKVVEWARTAEAQIIKEGRGGPSSHHQDLVLPVHVKIVSHECVMQSLECSTIEYFHVRFMRLKRLLVKTADQSEQEEVTPDAREGGDENTSTSTTTTTTTTTTTDDSCPLCLEEFGAAGTCSVRTPCSHKFHENCILTWMLKKPSCPVCRFEVPI